MHDQSKTVSYLKAWVICTSKVMKKFFCLPNLPLSVLAVREKSWSSLYLFVARYYLASKHFDSAKKCVLDAIRLYPKHFLKRRTLKLLMFSCLKKS